VPHPPEYERLLDLLRGEFRSRDERLAGVSVLLAQAQTYESVGDFANALRRVMGLPADLQRPISETR